VVSTLDVTAAAALSADEVLRRLGTSTAGLYDAEVASRRLVYGLNAVRADRARLLPVLWRQLRSPLLLLLAVAAVASYFVGERNDAVIIGVIFVASVGLGLVNEYRAEKAAEALHSQIRHRCVAQRDRHSTSVDITELVPGDVIVTGTPEGVGFARTPPVWLKAGDEVEVEISRIGVLRNRVEKE
jgi:Mg2+-importing ATPase